MTQYDDREGRYHDPGVYDSMKEYEDLVCRDVRGGINEDESHTLHGNATKWYDALKARDEAVNEQLAYRKAKDELSEEQDDDKTYDEEHLKYLRWRVGALGFQSSIKTRMRYVRGLLDGEE